MVQVNAIVLLWYARNMIMVWLNKFVQNVLNNMKVENESLSNKSS
jgi:hypothetical protein